MTLEQIQDYAIRHSLVPRYYFDDSSEVRSSSETRRDFPESVQEEILRRQNHRCNVCRSLLTTVDFDHVDGDNSNNSINNCQALCPACHRKKTGRDNSFRD